MTPHSLQHGAALALARCAAAAALGAAIGLMPGLAAAQQSPLVGYEDIDLFSNPPLAADLPNVLLLLDTSGNWSAGSATACTTYSDGTPGPNTATEQGKKIAIQKCALVNTLLALPLNADGSAKFRVGIMYMNAPNADGAYPRKAFVPVNSTNKPILAQALKDTSITSAADQGSNADYARALWEAYLWYKGMAPYKGKAQTNASRVRWDALAFQASGNYLSPSADSCGRNYVIIIANGDPQSNEADVKTLVQAAGGNVNEISYPSSYIVTANKNNWADETSRFLRGVDVSGKDDIQNIITYTVAITSANPTPTEVRTNNFIKEIAVQGGGIGYSAANVSDLTNALNAIFNQIQAVNSVFASASLPVSVNAQGTFLNQVFMGMFRPDDVGRPRWAGNLKQYQFAYNSATQKVDLADAAGNSAVNPTTGFIEPGARSFWSSATSPSYSDFWKNRTWAGEVNVGGAADAPDGQIVEKGGAAQRLREMYMTSQSDRKVFTTGGLLGGLRQFRKSTISPTELGLDTLALSERDALVDWVRGTDNKSPSDEQGPGTVTNGSATETATVRGSLHGDVIHSSPAVINYGGSTGVVVFYGSNGGMLHAVRGARTGETAGNELWSFVPEEFLTKFKRLRDNTVKVQFASTNMTSPVPDPLPLRKDYAMDGPTTFYQNLASGGRTYLYAAMRRGGRTLYAFDVTNPAEPSLLWRRGASGDLEALGQTWSEARVTRIAGIDDPVIIMGGGYDPAEDSSSPGTPSMGNIVVVLNARTGDTLKVFTGLARPVPASVAILDTSGDRKMDRAYAVDLGGSVYRMVFEGSTPSAWTITKIADFSGSSGTGQKMFYAPAVTPTMLGGSPVYAVQVGTGDREKPLQAAGTENRFFTVLDRGQADAKTIGDLAPMTTAGLDSIPSDKYGCYFNLPSAGEKVVNAVTYTSGFAFFGTNSPTPPSPQSCTGTLGVAKSYAIPALCGPVTVNTLDGGGFPPTAVVGTVLIAPPPGADGVQVNCETNPESCKRVPVGIGIAPPDCAGNPSTQQSSIGATNIYACAPAQRFRRDWSIRNPR